MLSIAIQYVDTMGKLKNSPGEVGIKIKKMIEQILSKDLGLKTIEAFTNVPNGSGTQTCDDFNPAE